MEPRRAKISSKGRTSLWMTRRSPQRDCIFFVVYGTCVSIGPSLRVRWRWHNSVLTLLKHPDLASTWQIALWAKRCRRWGNSSRRNAVFSWSSIISAPGEVALEVYFPLMSLFWPYHTWLGFSGLSVTPNDQMQRCWRRSRWRGKVRTRWPLQQPLWLACSWWSMERRCNKPLLTPMRPLRTARNMRWHFSSI